MRRFEIEGVSLVRGDAFRIMKTMKSGSVDLIFADPPYFLSDGGISCRSGRQVIVDKGKWDKPLTVRKRLEFNHRWIRLARLLLKDDGTIWISGTFHNIYAVGVVLEEEGFSIINNVTWVKPNPPPNLGCRCFTNSTETLLWARKALGKKNGRHFFDYPAMKEENGGKQMKDVWVIKPPPKREKRYGKHPTQKPVELLERIVKSSSKPGDTVFDPFMGSGTTAVASLKLGRKFIGIEKDPEYFGIAVSRVSNAEWEERQ